MKRFMVVLLGAVLLYLVPGVAAAEENGTPAAGWMLQDGKWHFYDEAGAMKTGWLLDQGAWYYLAPGDGAMQTGWVSDAGKWYYLDGHGAMKTGWVKDSGAWYYLDKHGAMVTGWLDLGNRKYYLDSRGSMATGWRLVGASWYYFDASGARAAGWRYVSGAWYYLSPRDGAMVKENFVSGYYLMSDGRMTNAGSSAVVSVVDGLKSWLDVGVTQAGLKSKLGSNYHDLTGIEGENYWLYTIKVTDTKTFKVVKLDEDDVGANELAAGKQDINLLVFWDGAKKAFQVAMDYFDGAHKFHTYRSLKYDYVYN
ncbi:MAG: hypothetical protein ABGX20_02570 [Bacillus sp. (in: firmicutes)]